MSSSAHDLAIVRILAFGGMLFLFRNTTFEPFVTPPAELWDPPLTIRMLGLTLVSVPTLRVLVAIWQYSMYASALGFLTRLSTLVSWALAFYLLGLQEGYVQSNFGFKIDFMVLTVLAFSRCADCYSFDSYLKRRLFPARSLFHQREVADPDFAYRWPLTALRCVSILPFFFAGITKMVQSGPGWIFNFEVVMKRTTTWFKHDTNPIVLGIRSMILSSKFLMVGGGLYALTTELLSPLPLFSRRLRPYLIVNLILFSLSICVVLEIKETRYLLITLPAWVPWRRVMDRLKSL